MRLDPSRPYGQVFGMRGVQYEQDGAYFRADGTSLEEPAQPQPAKRGPGRPRRALAAIYGEDADDLPAAVATPGTDRLAGFRGTGRTDEPSWVDGA